jgi:hypothetical protein
MEIIIFIKYFFYLLKYYNKMMLIIIILIIIAIIVMILISPSNTQLLTENSIRTFAPVSTIEKSIRTLAPVSTIEKSTRTFAPVSTTEIPIDCVVSDWSGWSNCSANCGGGTQQRTRSIITQPKGNGSKPCPSLTDTKVCNTNDCSVDCVVGDWSNWSACSANCGGGTQQRTRSILTQPKGNGISCPALTDTKVCNTDACPVDCVVSEWSNWSACSVNCGGGTQQRTRSILTQARNNGISCPELIQTKACNTEVCPVNCVVSDWSNWGTCTKSCGDGLQERTRNIITPSQGNGISCPEVRETKICNLATCPLYVFTSHTFTTAGKSGQNGPTLAEIRSAYSGINWAQNSEFLNMTIQGIQEWKVPATGNYTIRAVGAGVPYGIHQRNGMNLYQKGMDVTITYQLSIGEIIRILVGQIPINNYRNMGGAGGTFVVKGTQTSPTAIIIAGGGGGRGGGYASFNSNATISNNGQEGTLGGNGGSNGNGGNSSSNYGGGGGGLIGDGVSSSWAKGGSSFINGGVGGIGLYSNTTFGGFGGGGGGDVSGEGGGGGGYSGGGAGGYGGDIYEYYGGGGGGSYSITGGFTSATANNNDNGFVTITANF